MSARWIWYYGDFEFYHLKKVNYRRVERGLPFPPFWKQAEPFTCVCFERTATLVSEETFTVHAHGRGFLLIGGDKYSFGTPITLPAGTYTVYARVMTEGSLPCIFVGEGSFQTDERWLVSPFDSEKRAAGCNDGYTRVEDDPNEFVFDTLPLSPVQTERIGEGVLYDYGRETFAYLQIDEREACTLYFGETREEALDREHAYNLLSLMQGGNGIRTAAFGFRYLYIHGEKQPQFTAWYQRLPALATCKASFFCSDERLNRIWEIAGYTFELNSREFYLDGIKRDRWVWSGDAYQSYFVNRYYAFDKDIAARTIVALGGKDRITQHINTINDYTFYWLISVYEHYLATGDLAFVKGIFPRMKEYADFCISRLDGDGLVCAQEGDWIFIDWAEMDKEGPVCAEQMLFIKSLRCLCTIASLLGEPYETYEALAEQTLKKVNENYWDEEQGGFIDGFRSGKRQITRHANIFAVLFDIATPAQKESIVARVFLNEKIPPITTPYFKLYELEALCLMGHQDKVLAEIQNYWGEMVQAGATTFWEEFEKGKPWQNQLGMYGLKYGKSLCHAWGASPIYLIGRYLLGVYPTAAGYTKFCVEPRLADIDGVDAIVPVCGGSVHIVKDERGITVCADVEGGTLLWRGSAFPLVKNTPITV